MLTLRQKLRALAQVEMATDTAHDLAHLDRVWTNASEIAAKEPPCDQRALLAAAYLHDIVNLPKDAPNRADASRLACDRAAALLPGLGLSASEVATACHAILAHSYSAGIEPQTPEARILRDADRLDALGAVGVMRWLAVSGGLQRPLYHPDDVFAADRDLNDTSYALDHWRIKLQHLADGMLTRTGRAMAAERTATMQVFLSAFAREIGQDLPPAWST